MMDTDNENAAKREAKNFADLDAAQYWDEERIAGRRVADVLGLSSSAWDVYLMYGPGARRPAEGFPVPDAWFHQLPPSIGGETSRFLHPLRFLDELSLMLGVKDRFSSLAFDLHAAAVSTLTQREIRHGPEDIERVFRRTGVD